ncbi:MAG: DUF1566 domain-containing protein [Treponema sp.]|jgi:hypothetical protein|nr:DUF1566 domain-containing protein [Treponema sp.]
MKAYCYIVFVLLVCILPSACVLEGGPPGQAGGYVFYDKGEYSNGWRYLECAPEDAGEKCDWATAKSRCDDYSHNGYDDWRLPGDTEINWMYSNLYKKGMGYFFYLGDQYYWAVDSGGDEYQLDFSNGKGRGISSSDGFQSLCYTRPVRQF